MSCITGQSMPDISYKYGAFTFQGWYLLIPKGHTNPLEGKHYVLSQRRQLLNNPLQSTAYQQIRIPNDSSKETNPATRLAVRNELYGVCCFTKVEEKFKHRKLNSFLDVNLRPPMPVAARSKAQICGRVIAGIVGSNSAEGIDVFSCVCCVFCR
jgi:hypothetical protein